MNGPYAATICSREALQFHMYCFYTSAGTSVNLEYEILAKINNGYPLLR